MRALSNKQQEIHHELIKNIRQEKILEIKILELISLADDLDLALTLGYKSLTEYCRVELGLSSDIAYKRYQAMRALKQFPRLKPILERGETHVTTLSMIAPKITKENESKLLNFIPGKSKREVEAFISRLEPDGSFVDKPETVHVTLNLTLEELELLKRAQTLISEGKKSVSLEETAIDAVNKLLDHIDPMRKAERSLTRKSKKKTKNIEIKPEKALQVATPPDSDQEQLSRYIPRATRHQVFLRDGGRCAYRSLNGKQCNQEAGLAIDHIHEFALGGKHELKNLRLLCGAHNRLLAKKKFGTYLNGRPL